MAIPISVLAVSLDEIVTASGLIWSEVPDPAEEKPPLEPGVYVWVSSNPADQNAVLYLGRAVNLRVRLRSERKWVHDARAERPGDRQRWRSGHPRLVLRYEARLHYAVTGDIGQNDTAVDTERRLLHFCRFAAGSVPLINGSAWWNRGPAHDEAREHAWVAIEDAGLVSSD